MGLLETIKSLFGMGGSTVERSTETEVTVEHEPDAETEAAVKGDVGDPGAGGSADTDGADGGGSGDDASSDGTGGGSSTDGPGSDDADTAGEGVSVEEIKGIGPSYGERLAGAGVETVADLAVADPEDLAGRTELGESRLRTWVDRAREFQQ